MRTISRTSRTITNSTVALAIYVVNLVLQFFSRKIFLEYLGTEILGLNTTASNILQFLNLAELGISSAVGFTLYKPLLENNTRAINEIISLQKHLYRRIAIIVIIGASLILPFFPIIFAKIHLPFWYTYASFAVLLLSSLLGYFVNYKQILLSASQQEYKILTSYKLIVLLKITAQMIVIYNFTNGYVWWLVLEAIFPIIGSFILNYVIQKNFPNVRVVQEPYRVLRQKYKEFTIKIKQLFIHKIAGYVLTQVSPLILYAYTTLSMVALYGNYTIIITGLQSLVGSLFNSMNAGVGNLVAEGNDLKIKRVFSELFSIRFIIAMTICVTSYCFISSFVKLWIGERYLLPTSTVFLLLTILYIQIFRPNVESFTYAYGLFGDVPAAIIEAVLNIGLSILLGYKHGLNGILAGGLISQILIVVMWKPYYLFSRCMPVSFTWYITLYGRHLLVCIPIIYGCLCIIDFFQLNISYNWLQFLINTVLITVIVGSPLTAAILAMNRTVRYRLLSILKIRIK